jgi:hypothetical protein
VNRLGFLGRFDASVAVARVKKRLKQWPQAGPLGGKAFGLHKVSLARHGKEFRW